MANVEVAGWPLHCQDAPEEVCPCCEGDHDCFVEGTACKALMRRSKCRSGGIRSNSSCSDFASYLMRLSFSFFLSSSLRIHSILILFPVSFCFLTSRTFYCYFCFISLFASLLLVYLALPLNS